MISSRIPHYSVYHFNNLTSNSSANCITFTASKIWECFWLYASKILICSGKEWEFQFHKNVACCLQNWSTIHNTISPHFINLSWFGRLSVLIYHIIFHNFSCFSWCLSSRFIKCLYFSLVESENVTFNLIQLTLNKNGHVKHLNDVKKVWAESGWWLIM